MKRLAIDTLAILAGNVVFDKWIGKVEGSETGFITVQPGIGLDDLVRALTCVGMVFIARKFVP
jgi:hypothetical protein